MAPPSDTTTTLIDSEHARVQRTVLPSGLRVVTEHVPGAVSTLWAATTTFGSREERPRWRGAAHFLEHMLYAGTATLSSRDVVNGFDSIGPRANAETGPEGTCYWAHGAYPTVLRSADLIAELLTHADLDQASLDRERTVILNEIGRKRDNQEAFLTTQVLEILYRDHPLAHPQLGTAEQIEQMPREVLWQAYQHAVQPRRLIVTATGQVDHAQVVDAARHQFADLGDRHGEAAPEVPRTSGRPVAQYGGQRVLGRDIAQAHLMVGVGGVPQADARREAFDLLMVVLAGGVSSRLLTELREDRGLVYSVLNRRASLSDTGFGYVYTNCRPADFPEVIARVRENLTRIAEEGITEQELARAHAIRATYTTLGRERADRRTDLLVGSEMTGQYQSYEERLARLQAVTVADVNQLAETLMGPDCLRVETAQGPLPEDALGG